MMNFILEFSKNNDFMIVLSRKNAVFRNFPVSVLYSISVIFLFSVSWKTYHCSPGLHIILQITDKKNQNCLTILSFNPNLLRCNLAPLSK